MASRSFAPARLAPARFALLRFAPVRSAPASFAPASCASWKFAPCRSAPARSTPERSRRLKLAPARSHFWQARLRPARKSSRGSAYATPAASTAARNVMLAHIPAKWTPVRRQQYAPIKDAGAYSDSAGPEYALSLLERGFMKGALWPRQPVVLA